MKVCGEWASLLRVNEGLGRMAGGVGPPLTARSWRQCSGSLPEPESR